MTTEKQKEDEKFYLQRFIERDNCPLRDVNRNEIQHIDAPDFLIPSLDLGIEFTELFTNDPNDKIPRQAQENSWKSIIDKSKELWENTTTNPNIEVKIQFYKNSSIAKAEHATIARKIVEVIQKNLPEQGSRQGIKAEDEFFPKEVAYISIIRISDYTENYFNMSDGEWSGELTKERLQNELSKKSAKVAEYRRNCAQVWLVITIDQMRMSSICHIPDSTLNENYQTPFDRVFVLEKGTYKLTELSINRVAVQTV